MIVRAYAAMQEKAALKPFEYESGALLPCEVEVAITHCSICHSDVHLVDNDWGISTFPLVPGHEIIGTVCAIGSAVSQFKIGQRVGIGWQCNSCLTCDTCSHGDENLCSEAKGVAVAHHGGFAERVRSHAHFVVPIPDALASEHAAPLLCAGITVYSPFRHYHVRPHMKVGVIGIGGLGHLALQFAKAFGCEVTAFSSDSSKEKEAREFGAHHFVNSIHDDALDPHKNTFDFMLSTVSASLNWEKYISLLRAHGTLCFVGVANRIDIPVMSLIGGNKTVCGSLIGGPRMIKEMLEFAARHHIHAKTQLMPMDQANDALNLVRNNKARYRIVLKNT
ncbi:MAG: alcohol dehydrogenase [Gammaproteobacteria bacterium CG_4_10_14_0_8_um_filter_38_16]|nr:MAG: alcohol dehydrogenase [Gammaproteobacteria bacterium CG_4_10_14_0_8_um_filter_38_16]PJA02801.1 MAG: alcohol dehydrogenase [Gammaproteobacteria bacterium CG_4_10_14_0_2_um_filter_38_22]PJB10708.1 MAG: alcohol dehydrogenase [Gammaproteobacteria bacterium CG_4_9_14_3_um_filter_38_9]